MNLNLGLNKQLRNVNRSCILAQMTTYELVFIFDSEKVSTAKEAKALAKKLLEPVKAKVLKEAAWGERQLAYPINKKASGWYLVLEIELSGDKVQDLHKNIKLEGRVLRHLLVKR